MRDEPKLTDLVGLAADGSWGAYIDDQDRHSTYGDAIVAAVKVMDSPDYSYMLRGSLAGSDVRAIVEAAAPLIERAALERAALELLAWAHTLDRDNPALRTLRRHIGMCARRIGPKMTDAEVVEALQRGDFAVCHLDEAGRSISPADRSDGEASRG